MSKINSFKSDIDVQIDSLSAIIHIINKTNGKSESLFCGQSSNFSSAQIHSLFKSYVVVC